MFLFSFEVDVLEIALREQQDLVDKIFLVESSASHRGVRKFSFHRWTGKYFQVSKPLLWQSQRLQERFDFVDRSKLVHVVADDSISQDWELYEL